MGNKFYIKGFTLIELLFVIAVISVLAAIAVPNFLEAQVRAKVTRAYTDMGMISTALEAYKVDNGHFPLISKPIDGYELNGLLDRQIRAYQKYEYVSEMTGRKCDFLFLSEELNKSIDISEEYLRGKLAEKNFCFSPSSEEGLFALTTPVVYMSNEIVKEIFLTSKSGSHRYIELLQGDPMSRYYKYINLLQVNPQGYDIADVGNNIPYVVFSTGPDYTFSPFPFPPIEPVAPYDSTNGTTSFGTLYQWGK